MQQTENSKAYLIQINSVIKQGQELNFTYNVELEENLDYGQKATSSYKVEYVEGEVMQNQVASENTQMVKYLLAQEQNTSNIMQEEASPVVLTTGEGAILNVTLKDDTVNNIMYNQTYTKLNLSINNSGTSNAENVKITIPLPDGIYYAIVDEETNLGDGYVVQEETRQIDLTIGTIASGTTANKEIILYANGQDGTSAEISVTISGENIENQTKTLNKTIKNRLVEMKLSQDDNFIVNRQSSYSIYIYNENEMSYNGAKIVVDIPTEFEFDGAEVLDYNYEPEDEEEDENGGVLTTVNSLKNGKLEIDLSSIQAEEIIINIYVTPKVEIQKTITVSFEANGNTQSACIETKVEQTNVDVSVSTNVESGSYIKPSEEVTYQITIKNNSQKDLNSIYTYIKYGKGFDVSNAKVDGVKVVSDEDLRDDDIYDEYLDGDEDYDGKEIEIPETDEEDYVEKDIELIGSNTISVKRDIKVGETISFNVSANLYDDIQISEDRNITNTISIDYLEYEKKYNYIIEKNINSNNNENNNDNNNENNTNSYKITGTAWLDADKNGKMDEEEQKLSNIPVKAINEQGNEIASTSTSEDGKYTLEGLKNGNYTVVFEYDTTKYMPTTYQAQGVEETLNSNVVKGNMQGKTVATTNIINIADRSIGNINIGLIEGAKFDLSLDKKVTQISMVNKKTTKTKKYNTNLAKIDLDYKYINGTNVAIEYEITVTNQGDIAGYATQITDYLPEGFDFSTELNKNWYTSNGNIQTKELANTIINPGESKTVKLILTKSMTENDNDIYVNTAEITEDYNEYGEKDSDSTPGNNTESEDDQASANVILGLKTGGPITYITLTITIMALICIGAYEINKKVLKI